MTLPPRQAGSGGARDPSLAGRWPSAAATRGPSPVVLPPPGEAGHGCPPGPRPYRAQKALGFLDGPVAAQESHEHHHGAHGDENVDACSGSTGALVPGRGDGRPAPQTCSPARAHAPPRMPEGPPRPWGGQRGPRPTSQVVRQLELIHQGRPHVPPDVASGDEHLSPRPPPWDRIPLGTAEASIPCQGPEQPRTSGLSPPGPGTKPARLHPLSRHPEPRADVAPATGPGSPAPGRGHRPGSPGSALLPAEPVVPGPQALRVDGEGGGSPSYTWTQGWDTRGHAWLLLAWTPGGGAAAKDPGRSETGPAGPGVPRAFRHLCSGLKDCGPHVCSRGGRLTCSSRPSR